MDKHIEIEYRNLPSHLFDGIKNTVEIKDTSIEVVCSKVEYSNFTGIVDDVSIYINKHLAELIVAGTIPVVYDLVKYVISSVWKKIRSFHLKKKARVDGESCISLNFKVHTDTSIEFRLDGNIKEDKVDELIDKMFAYMADKERLHDDLNDTRFISEVLDSRKASLKFNFKSQNWELINYAELRKQMDAFQRGINLSDN